MAVTAAAGDWQFATQPEAFGLAGHSAGPSSLAVLVDPQATALPRHRRHLQQGSELARTVELRRCTSTPSYRNVAALVRRTRNSRPFLPSPTRSSSSLPSVGTPSPRQKHTSRRVADSHRPQPHRCNQATQSAMTDAKSEALPRLVSEQRCQQDSPLSWRTNNQSRVAVQSDGARDVAPHMLGRIKSEPVFFSRMSTPVAERESDRNASSRMSTPVTERESDRNARDLFVTPSGGSRPSTDCSFVAINRRATWACDQDQDRDDTLDTPLKVTLAHLHAALLSKFGTLRKGFKALDSRGAGSLTLEGFKIGLEQVGISVASLHGAKNVKRAFQAMDFASTGTVSFSDMVAVMDQDGQVEEAPPEENDDWQYLTTMEKWTRWCDRTDQADSSSPRKALWQADEELSSMKSTMMSKQTRDREYMKKMIAQGAHRTPGGLRLCARHLLRDLDEDSVKRYRQKSLDEVDRKSRRIRTMLSDCSRTRNVLLQMKNELNSVEDTARLKEDIRELFGRHSLLKRSNDADADRGG